MGHEVEHQSNPDLKSPCLPEFLVRDAYGDIRLRGHRVSIFHILTLAGEGLTPPAILDEFPTLSVDLIAAVLAYYRENRAELDDYFARYAEEIEEQEAAPGRAPDLAELKRREVERSGRL